MLDDPSQLLSQYPALKFLVAFAVAAVTILAMIRGERMRNAAPPPQHMPLGTQMFIEGPTKAHLDALGRIALATEATSKGVSSLIKLGERIEAAYLLRMQLDDANAQRDREAERDRWSDLRRSLERIGDR